MQTHRLLCFGARPGAGNPALVIEDGPSEADARQALAREHGTTCVFVDEYAGDDAVPRIDYFYPHMRSPLCLHATLAVAAVLFARPGAPATIEVETAMKGQRLALLREGREGHEGREGGDYFVRLAPQSVPAADVSRALAEQLLRGPGVLLGSPLVASVGSPKLLVQVRDVETLHALAPDLAAIAGWGKANGVNGIYAWCERLDAADSYEGRNFNHLDPQLEDSATGVAAGALTVALGRGLALRQGRATGRDCLIRTRVENDTVLVGGAAETA
jgi:PhzF family phenazine biosynthesis protein